MEASGWISSACLVWRSGDIACRFRIRLRIVQRWRNASRTRWRTSVGAIYLFFVFLVPLCTNLAIFTACNANQECSPVHTLTSVLYEVPCNYWSSPVSSYYRSCANACGNSSRFFYFLPFDCDTLCTRSCYHHCKKIT